MVINSDAFAHGRQVSVGVLASLAMLLLLAGAAQANGATPSATAAANPPANGWTTLGTRASQSAPEPRITRNAGAKWSDYDPPALYPKTAGQPLQYITTPDGTQLAAYVTLPADADGNAAEGPFPTVLIQTPYNGNSGQFVREIGGADPYIVKHGYATVVVDVRGTGQSQGRWHVFGKKEQADYGHTVDWVTQQPWNNGVIGLYGVSYLGITAIITAAQNHPAVKAAFPIVPIGDGYRDLTFTGGQVNPTFIPAFVGLVSMLGLPDPSVLTNPKRGLPAVLQHLGSTAGFQVPLLAKGLLGNKQIAFDSPFWEIRSPLERDDQIEVPTFIVGGLHDLFQRSEPIDYEQIKTHAPTKLLIGPWTHIQAAVGKGLPADGIPKFNHIELRWFDQYLKGDNVGAPDLPNVTQFVSGFGHYVTATDWPNPEARAQRLYLHADKRLTENKPAAGAAPNHKLQVPTEGLCSQSLDQFSAGIAGVLPLPCLKHDNSTERFNDIVYQTAPMDADTYINGPIQADIWMSTTARDAGLSVRVADVDENGVATALTQGLQTVSLRAVDKTRSRYLDGEMIQPWHPYTKASAKKTGRGKIVKVPVEIFTTSAMIVKGHRLRVGVGPSDLPRGVAPAPALLRSVLGRLTIYNDAKHPSSVVVPLVPASELQASGS